MAEMDPAKRNALRLMNEAGVPYVLLSGFYGDSGGDLDILIPMDGIAAFSRFCQQKEVLQQRRPAQFSNHFFYFLHAQGHRPLRIHVKYECTFFDARKNAFRSFTEANGVIGARERYEDWFVPVAWHLILLYAAKCAFVEKTSVSASQLAKLSDFVLRNQNSLTDPAQSRFIEQLLKATAIEAPKAASDALAHLLLPYFPLAHASAVGRPLRLWDRAGFPAYTLLFVGCDGSGKSSLLHLLRHELELPAERLYGGLGPAEWLFPWIDSFRHRVALASHGIRELGILLWMLVLFPLELTGRVMRRAGLAKHAVLLVDRFPEFAFVGKWARLTARIYRAILPKPSMVIEVIAPISVLLERRGDELDMEMAVVKSNEARLLAAYFLQRGARGLKIDSSILSLEESVATVLQHLWADPRFAARMLKPATFPPYAVS